MDWFFKKASQITVLKCSGCQFAITVARLLAVLLEFEVINADNVTGELAQLVIQVNAAEGFNSNPLDLDRYPSPALTLRFSWPRIADERLPLPFNLYGYHSLGDAEINKLLARDKSAEKASRKVEFMDFEEKKIWLALL